jgi:hypothetical protein
MQKHTATALTLAFTALLGCDAPDNDHAEAALAAIPDDASADEVDGYLMSVDALAEASDPAAGGWTWVPPKSIKAYTCEPGNVCGAPISQDWCAVYKDLAVKAQIPAVYIGIMETKCKANQNGACFECWDLSNYCSQVGKSCAGIQDACTCLADKLGEI